MWHEARKQEKMIRGLIVDYRRRAERRKDFYEKIKADPTQFLQIHGRPCRIHLDPAVAAAGEGPAIMMQWQGDASNMIDRFDVRAHLDHIPDVKNPEVPPEDLSTEERHCNYERYRILAQNAFLGMGEDKFLQQLAIEEQFGVTLEEKEVQRERLNERKGTGAAIGYNYNDPGAQPSSSNGSEVKKMEQKDKESDDDSDLEILDVDLSIDVNKMEPSQAHELNAVGPSFGMAGCDLFSFLTGDADDAEHQRQLLIEEKEKAMYSGRKSRRERRAHRDKKLATRVVSPPSYAAPSSLPEKSPSRSPSRSPSPEAAGQIQFITSFGGDEDEAKPRELYHRQTSLFYKLATRVVSPPSYAVPSSLPEKSPSRSPSPEAAGQIQFITSFGGDEDEAKPPSAKALYSAKVKQNLKKLELYSEVARKHKQRSPISEESYPCPIGPRGPNSRSRSKSSSKSRSPTRSRSRSPRSRSRSRRSRSRSQRSRSRSRYTSRSRSSRSRSRSRSSSYRRSRSRSCTYRNRRSRSPNYSKRKKSRSMSYDSDSDRGGQSKPTVSRYYGRRKEDKSSSELSLDSASSDDELHKHKKEDKSSSELSLDSASSDDELNKHKLAVGNKSNAYQNQLRSSGSSSKGSSRKTQSLKEKLKKKMQAQLSRQLRADKRAEAERVERESRRQARRDEEMRELAIKLRRKQREMRHRYRRSSDESDRSRSRSSSRESTAGDKKTSRSRSRSPTEKRVPIWEKDSAPYRADEPPLPPLPPLNTLPPPPFIRKRNQEEDYTRSYHQDKRDDRSRSKSPKRIPVWETQRDSYPDSRRPKYQEDGDYRYENTRRYDNRYEQNQPSQVDNRWDSSRRRPYGNRGGYRGYTRPPLPPGVGPANWQRDQGYEDDDRSQVKLVDY